MSNGPVKYGLMSGIGRGLGRAGESIARGMMAGYARDERERVRAEDLRRYEAQRELEAERHKERQRQYGAKIGFEAMRHATPESLPMWMDEMRRVGTPLADYEGTLTPTQGMVPTGQTELVPMRSDEWLPTGPAMPIALPPAIGGPEDPMGPPEFALQKERGVVFGRPAEGIPEYELGEIAPTHPLGAAVHARIGREETKRLRGLKEKASEYFGKSLSPIEQARHFGIHYLDPKTGEVADMPIAQALRHIEGMEEETAAELNAKIDLARAGRSGRRGPRPQKMTLTELEADIKAGDFDAARDSLSRYKPEAARWDDKRKNTYLDGQLNRIVRKAMAKSSAKIFQQKLKDERKSLSLATSAYNKAKWHDADKPKLRRDMINAMTRLDAARGGYADALRSGVGAVGGARAPAEGKQMTAQQVRQLRGIKTENRPKAIENLRKNGFRIPREFLE